MAAFKQRYARQDGLCGPLLLLQNRRNVKVSSTGINIGSCAISEGDGTYSCGRHGGPIDSRALGSFRLGVLPPWDRTAYSACYLFIKKCYS